MSVSSSWGGKWLLQYLKQTKTLGRGYLHDFADDPVEKSHQLACGQLNFLFQLVHGFMLQANSQEKSLEDGKSSGAAEGQALAH